MPTSRKRKKSKSVHKGTLKVDPQKESNITLQDLINVVAFQELTKTEATSPPKIEDQKKGTSNE